MKFETVRRGELVKYRTTEISQSVIAEIDTRWQHEPMDCVMYVDSIALDGEIFLSCASDCGGHLIESINQEEYQEWSNLLGATVLRASGVNEHLASASEYNEDDRVVAAALGLDLKEFHHSPRLLQSVKQPAYLRYDEDYEVINILDFLAREI